MFDFQNPPSPTLDEQVPKQPNKEGEGHIPYSSSYCPISTPVGKECNAGQTVSDWNEKEENGKPKAAVLTSPPQ